MHDHINREKNGSYKVWGGIRDRLFKGTNL